MKKNKSIENIKKSFVKYYSKLNERERKLLFLMVGIVVFFGIASLKPVVINSLEKFSKQDEELQQALRAKGQAPNLIRQLIALREKRQEIEKNFEKNKFKEGHLSYCDSLKSSEMTNFAIGTQQEKPFGKDFKRTTFKINFQAPSLQTVISFIKNLENEKRKYLISELTIKKAYNKFAVVIEVNSIEKKK